MTRIAHFPRPGAPADGLPPRADSEGGQSTERPSLASLEAEIERLKAVQYVLAGDLAALRQVLAAAGLGMPAVETGESWLTLKQASGLCGYSLSGLRRRIDRGEIKAMHIGGRVLVNANTLGKGGEKTP